METKDLLFLLILTIVFIGGVFTEKVTHAKDDLIINTQNK